MDTNLSMKTYVVTGATSGIGLATAELLARSGVGVIGIGRSAERCREAEARLRLKTGGENIHYLLADLSLQRNVRTLAERIGELLADDGKNALDGLVNNAGVFTYWLTLTPDGIEMQWAVNHLAPFLLTLELLPFLKQAPFARVITVSSDSHRSARLDWNDPQLCRRYNGLRAYSNTKLANILFTQALNNRLSDTPDLRAFAVDPGLVKTDIGMKGTPALVRWVWRLRRSGGTPAETPARGIVHLLSEPSLENTEIYWKDGRPKASSRASLDASSARRLWALSEKMCGVTSEVNHASE